jgi:hypothetical protein
MPVKLQSRPDLLLLLSLLLVILLNPVGNYPLTVRSNIPHNYGDIIIRNGRICVFGRREYGLRVSEQFLKCVAFVGEMIDADTPGDFHGTGFFLSVPAKSPELEGFRFGYFVTAKHVAEALQDHNVYMRVNKVGGGTTDFQNTFGQNWYLHPTDKTADVAIVPLAGQPNADVGTVGIEELGTTEALAKLQVGIGDEVFSVGLFTPVGENTSTNIPIVRYGTIAMMPPEQIQTELGYADVYLVEARSLGGLSGSPVFARPTMKIDIPEVCGINKMLGVAPGSILLGIMQSHWDVKESEMNNIYFVNDRKRGVNYGMAVVVPASKILDILNRPELVEMRTETENRKLRRKVAIPGMDSAKPKQETQITPAGAEIPIPTQEQFLGDLNKVSRKIKPN